MTATRTPGLQKILDATATVLAESGYSGATLAQIAEQAGMQAASLYHYFPSKESLVEEVLTEAVQQTRLEIERHLASLPGSATPDQRLTAGIEAMMLAALDRRTYAAAHLRCTGQVRAGTMPRLSAELRLMNDLWQGLLVAALSGREGFVADRPAIVRLLIMGAISWSVEWPDYARQSPSDVARTLVELIFNGLGGTAS